MLANAVCCPEAAAFEPLEVDEPLPTEVRAFIVADSIGLEPRYQPGNVVLMRGGAVVLIVADADAFNAIAREARRRALLPLSYPSAEQARTTPS